VECERGMFGQGHKLPRCGGVVSSSPQGATRAHDIRDISMLTSLNLALTRCILQVCSVLKVICTIPMAECCLVCIIQ